MCIYLRVIHPPFEKIKKETHVFDLGGGGAQGGECWDEVGLAKTSKSSLYKAELHVTGLTSP